MELAVEKEEYELAAELRDKINKLDSKDELEQLLEDISSQPIERLINKFITSDKLRAKISSITNNLDNLVNVISKVEGKKEAIEIIQIFAYVI